MPSTANPDIRWVRVSKTNNMKIQLIKGSFSNADAMDLLNNLVSAKIRFHESRIEKSLNEEDIKMRESRIKELQRDLHEARKKLAGSDLCELSSDIVIG